VAIRLALLAVLIGISGCSTMKPEDFAGREPALVIEDYFAGRTKAWGIFQDRFGQLRRQFEVEIQGDWDGKTLTLVEDFLYDDGETEQRVWRITKRGEHAYEGRADGVIGVGVFRYATCGRTLNDTVAAMRHVADLVGVRHVALGSDFDGATATVFDATGWPRLTEALMAAGFSELDIAGILGGNALRVLQQALP